MEKVKAGLRGLSAEDKATLGESVYSALLGNTHFPDPQPSLATYRAVLDELKEANVDALDRGRRACARKRVAVAAFDKATARLAAYVNSVALGDVAKLGSSGFPAAKRPEPQNNLEQPNVIDFRRTHWENRVEMRWKRVPGALIYQVERTLTDADQEGTWERVGLTTRPKLAVERERNGKRYAYRVCAIGAHLQGPYSPVKMPMAA